jgi:hypothetical protein
VDEDLRELERIVARGGDAASRLRLARALERAGRRDEVPSVLRPAVADERVRQALLELPAWRHPCGDAGRTNEIDLPPLRALRSVRTVRPSAGNCFPEALLATESGLVVVERARGGVRTIIIDAASGEERKELGAPDSAIAIEDDRVVAQAVFAYDLWTGELAFQVLLDGHLLAALPGRTVLVQSHGRFGAFTWLEGAELSFLWEQPLAGDSCGVAATPSWVVAWTGAGELAAYRTRDGDPLWSQPLAPPAERVLLDEAGLVLARRGHEENDFDVLDRDGNPLWTSELRARPVALGRDHVLATVRKGRRGDIELVVMDRRSGERKTLLHEALGFWNEIVCVAVAREVVYFTAPREKALFAASLRGDVLWRHSLEGLGQVLALAPVAHGLYAACSGGLVVRFA